MCYAAESPQPSSSLVIVLGLTKLLCPIDAHFYSDLWQQRYPSAAQQAVHVGFAFCRSVTHFDSDICSSVEFFELLIGYKQALQRPRSLPRSAAFFLAANRSIILA